MKINRTNFLISFGITGLLFGIVFFFLSPCYNTDVDIYFLYTLAGGYGNEPDYLLHYSDIAHPVLSAFVAALFRVNPSVNWYSCSLILFHFISCITLFYSFLNYCRRMVAVAGFFLFFLFIESRLLLNFNFSGAALMGTIAGSVFLVLKFAKDNGTAIFNKSFILPFSLLVIGGLTRVHYMVLFGIFISSIAFFFLPLKQFARLIKIEMILGIIVVIFFLGQRYYFSEKIPGWKQEEKFRKANIYYSNHPHATSREFNNGIDSLKQGLMEIYFLYDTRLFDYQTVKDFGRNNTKSFDWHSITVSSLYWLFMDLKIYFVLFVVAMIFLWGSHRRKRMLYLLYSIALPLLVLLVLYFFFKVTAVIIVAFAASLALASFLFAAGSYGNKVALFTGTAFLLAASVAMVFRVSAISKYNREKIALARNIITELDQHPGILFADAGAFYNFHLSVWDVPRHYPLKNFIYNELFFSNSYKKQLARFGIRDLMQEMPDKDNIYLTGDRAVLMADYYRLIYKQQVTVEPVPGFQFIKAYRVRKIKGD